MKRAERKLNDCFLKLFLSVARCWESFRALFPFFHTVESDLGGLVIPCHASIKEKEYKMEEQLKSPGWGVDSRALRDPSALGDVKGAWAPPSSILADIENVAGMRVLGAWRLLEGVMTWSFPEGLLDAPFVRAALHLLEGDPVREGVKLRPLGETPDSSMYRPHLKKLLQLTQLVLCCDPRAGGIYSAVYKDPPEARTIFNHKYVNEFAVEGVPFNLLSSFGLVEILHMFDFGTDEWAIVHGDVKSAYHQLPAGEMLGRCTCVRMGDQWLRPRTVVMGHKNSCGICQAIMFGMILFGGGPELGIPPEAATWETAPGHVWLTHGGVVILVYDSIFAIVPAHLQTAWKNHIGGNAKRINCILKFLIAEPRLSAERDSEWGQPFAFCGVSLDRTGRGLTWRLEDDSLAIWKSMTRVPLLRSPRTMYAFLGYLRFAQPICGMQRRQLGPLTLEQSKLGQIQDWDAEVVDATVITQLCDLVMGIHNRPQHRKSHLPGKRVGYEALFVAVDATPWRYSVVPMVPDGNGGGVILDDYTQSGSFRDSMKFREYVGPDGKVDIDMAEALVMGVGTEITKSFGAAVWIIGGDNQGVGYGYDKGFSRSEGVNGVIRLANIPPEQRMVIADIPTWGNIADIATRPEEHYSSEQKRFRTETSWNRMWHAYQRWYRGGMECYHLRYCEECNSRDEQLAKRLGVTLEK